MNKQVLIIFILIVAFSCANGQTAKKYLLGVDFWAAYSHNYDPNPNYTAYRYNTANINGALYGGRFITPKTLLFLSFSTYYTNNSYIYNNTNPVSTDKAVSLSIFLLPSIGIRRYWAFTDKDVVGLFTDVIAGMGVIVNRNKSTLVINGKEEHKQSTHNANGLRFAVVPGAYLNLNKNWQLLIKVGSLNYSRNWAKDDGTVVNGVIQSSKLVSYGLSFNNQTFAISVARRL
jgi:hypothetical protein